MADLLASRIETITQNPVSLGVRLNVYMGKPTFQTLVYSVLLPAADAQSLAANLCVQGATSGAPSASTTVFVDEPAQAGPVGTFNAL